MTRDYVIALKVVLADGSIVSVGRTTAKGVTGYDLVGLLVGSEGTLGVITEVTVRLLPLRSHPTRAVVGYFNSLADAGRAVAAVSRLSTVPGALELIDRTCLRAVAEWKGLALPVDVEAMLLIRIEEPGDAGAAAIDEIVRCLEDSGGSDVRQAHSEAEADLLFLARRLAYPALERLGPVLTEDVCVPKRRVPDMLLRIQAAARDHDVVIANIAHAGDGNLHPLIVVPEGDEAAKSRAKLAFDRIVADCLDLGGTVTGEHGVGLLKLAGTEAELPRRVLQLHGDIKDALDPNGTLNPGKAFPGSLR
ncbi:FAD-binding oxidoreductase [Leucobacter sp. BZR 635]